MGLMAKDCCRACKEVLRPLVLDLKSGQGHKLPRDATGVISIERQLFMDNLHGIRGRLVFACTVGITA